MILRFQLYKEVTHKGAKRIEEFKELMGIEYGNIHFKDALTHNIKKKSFKEVE